MGFRYGVIEMEVPVFRENTNVGSAVISDNTITITYRGGYATLLNEIVDDLLIRSAVGIELKTVPINIVPAPAVSDA